jgi:hypothetical protein
MVQTFYYVIQIISIYYYFLNIEKIKILLLFLKIYMIENKNNIQKEIFNYLNKLQHFCVT